MLHLHVLHHGNILGQRSRGIHAATSARMKKMISEIYSFCASENVVTTTRYSDHSFANQCKSKDSTKYCWPDTQQQLN